MDVNEAISPSEQPLVTSPEPTPRRASLAHRIIDYINFSKTRFIFLVLIVIWTVSLVVAIPLWLYLTTVSAEKQLLFFLLHIYLPTGLFVFSGLYVVLAYLNYYKCTLDLCEIELAATITQIQSKATSEKVEERMQKRLGEMIRKFRDNRVKPDAFRLMKFFAEKKIIVIPQSSPANIVKAVDWLKEKVSKLQAVNREKSSKSDIAFLKATYHLVRRLPSLTAIMFQVFMCIVAVGSFIAIPVTTVLYTTQNRYCVNVEDNTISPKPVADINNKCSTELNLAKTQPGWDNVLCLSMCVAKNYMGLSSPDALSCPEYFQVAQCVASRGGVDPGYMNLRMKRDARSYSSSNWCPTVSC